MSRAQLTDLVQETGARSVTRLKFHARKRGWNPTKADLTAVVNSLGEKQVLMPLQPARGQTATDGIGMRIFVDLADFKEAPDKGMRYFVVLIDVFNREVWTAPLPNKEQETVRPILRDILKGLVDAAPGQTEIFTDAGQEFQGSVDAMLQAEDLVHRTKSHGKLDTNALAVVDRAIQNVKTRIAQIMGKGKVSWVDALEQATLQYNNDFHSTVRDSPLDGRDTGELVFMLLQDNAKKYQHNQEHLEKRKKLFESLGSYRKPLAESTMKFHRGFKATYGDKVDVVGFDGSQVLGADGSRHDQKILMPVSQDSTTALPTYAFTDVMKRRARAILSEEGLPEKLLSLIPEEGTIALTVLGRQIRTDFPYEETMQKARLGLGAMAQAMRLYPELFVLEVEPNPKFVRRAA
jgi:hypothetical protein